MAAVVVTLVDGSHVTHGAATKWIADPGGNLVIIGTGAKASHIYARTAWTKAEVKA